MHAPGNARWHFTAPIKEKIIFCKAFGMIFVSTRLPPATGRWHCSFTQHGRVMASSAACSGFALGSFGEVEFYIQSFKVQWGHSSLKLPAEGLEHPGYQASCGVYPNGSSAGDWKWGVMLYNHLGCVLTKGSELCDLKMRLRAARGQFTVRGLCKNAKDPLVLPPLEPGASAWVPAASPTRRGVGG